MQLTTESDDGTNVGNRERLVSALGGGLLTLYGVSRRDGMGLAAAAVGLALLKRGATGHCDLYERLGVSTDGDHLHAEDASVDPESAVVVEQSVVVDRSAAACYRTWRDFEGLPRFMDTIERVEVLDATRSRWLAKGPPGVMVEWEAEIVRDVENERIAWHSVDPADVANRGVVEFREHGDGTEVSVTMEWDPPGGGIGRALAAFFHRDPERETRNALERFRQIMETPSD